MNGVNDTFGNANLFDIARDDDLLDALAAREFDGVDDKDGVAALLAAWTHHIDDEAVATFADRDEVSASETSEPAGDRGRGGLYSASPRHGVASAVGRGWWAMGTSARVRTGATAAAAGLVLSLSGVAAAVSGARLPSLHGLTLTSSNAQSRDAVVGDVPQATATDVPSAPDVRSDVEPQAAPSPVGAPRGDNPHRAPAPERPAPHASGATASGSHDSSWPQVESRASLLVPHSRSLTPGVFAQAMPRTNVPATAAPADVGPRPTDVRHPSEPSARVPAPRTTHSSRPVPAPTSTPSTRPSSPSTPTPTNSPTSSTKPTPSTTPSPSDTSSTSTPRSSKRSASASASDPTTRQGNRGQGPATRQSASSGLPSAAVRQGLKRQSAQIAKDVSAAATPSKAADQQANAGGGPSSSTSSSATPTDSSGDTPSGTP